MANEKVALTAAETKLVLRAIDGLIASNNRAKTKEAGDEAIGMVYQKRGAELEALKNKIYSGSLL